MDIRTAGRRGTYGERRRAAGAPTLSPVFWATASAGQENPASRSTISRCPEEEERGVSSGSAGNLILRHFS